MIGGERLVETGHIVLHEVVRKGFSPKMAFDWRPKMKVKDRATWISEWKIQVEPMPPVKTQDGSWCHQSIQVSLPIPFTLP